MHAHASANITQALVTAVSLCLSAQLISGQAGAQTQTFVIHGSPKTCSAITQLDSALSANYQQFFAGWTEKDYVDAVAWSRACSEYGWHIPGQPRTQLLQAQHDRALGSVQAQITSNTATAGALPNTPVKAAMAAPAQAVPSAAAGSVLPRPAVRADIPAQAQTVSGAATGGVLPGAPVPADSRAHPQTGLSTATGSALPSPRVQAAVSAPAQAVPSGTTRSVLSSPSAQAAVAAPAQVVPSAATGGASPDRSVQAVVAALAQAVSSGTKGSVLPSPSAQAAVAAPVVPRAAAGGALPNRSVQSVVAAPARAVRSAAAGSSVLPVPPVPVDIPVRAQTVSSTATDNVLSSSPVRTDIPAQPQTASAAKGSALPSPRVRGQTASDGEGDSLLADNFFKEHFHQESLWVANKANLDIGVDREPSRWPSSGIPAQMKNRLTADKIVLYCARKTNEEPGKPPLLWDLRRCEAEEASAYKRLVSGNEFPTAGRGAVLGCAGVESYIYLERCMETLTETGKH